MTGRLTGANTFAASQILLLQILSTKRGGTQYISKNYYLRPELPVHLTHGTLRTQTDVLDATSDRRRVRNIPLSSSHLLTPSGHGPVRPVRPDDV